MTTKQASKIRLPRTWSKRIQELANCSATTVTKVIQAGDTDHPAWAAYEQLLEEAVQIKSQQQERVAKAKKLQAQLAA